jgi:hypothetical protein
MEIIDGESMSCPHLIPLKAREIDENLTPELRGKIT